MRITRGMGQELVGWPGDLVGEKLGQGRWWSCFSIREIDGREKEMLKIDDCGLLISPCRVQKRQAKG